MTEVTATWLTRRPPKDMARDELIASLGHETTDEGDATTMQPTTNEEKYPLEEFTRKPKCSACLRTRFGTVKTSEFASTSWRQDARYTYRTCKRCGAALRMKYAVDSEHVATEPSSRAAGITWKVIRALWNHRYITTVGAIVAWHAAKDPSGTMTAATNIAAKLTSLFTVLAS